MSDSNPTYTDQKSADQASEATLVSRLSMAPGLGDVNATVSSGVAMLTGQVPEEMDVRRCVLIAQAVEGIRDVRHRLRVVGAAPAASAPVTMDEIGDDKPIDENLNTPALADDYTQAKLIKEGMDVFDSEEKKVGKVKEVRVSDFLLGRLLARGYYVPYLSCTVSEDGVHLKVKGSEINDQGWAFPHMENMA